MADRGWETGEICKRHAPQKDGQEKRRVSNDQMHALFICIKGQLFHVRRAGFQKM